jgi:hypothetical protein
MVGDGANGPEVSLIKDENLPSMPTGNDLALSTGQPVAFRIATIVGVASIFVALLLIMYTRANNAKETLKSAI